MSDETNRDDARTTDELLADLQKTLNVLSERFKTRMDEQGPEVINHRSLGDRDIIQFHKMLHATLTKSGYWHPLVARNLAILGDLARLAKEDWFSGLHRPPGYREYMERNVYPHHGYPLTPPSPS